MFSENGVKKVVGEGSIHGFGSVFIWYGSRVLWPKKITDGKKFIFTIYLSLGIHKGRLSYKRSLKLSKENIQHFKTWNFLILFYFCGPFCPPGSGSGSSYHIESRSTDPLIWLNPDPKPWFYQCAAVEGVGNSKAIELDCFCRGSLEAHWSVISSSCWIESGLEDQGCILMEERKLGEGKRENWK